jgi:hypothetical protein
VALVMLVLALTGAACAEGATDRRAIIPAPTVAATVTTSTLPVATTVVATTTTLTAESTTTIAPADTTTTVAPTTVPAFVRELVLRPDGVGGARFGADAESVISYVTGLVGAPSADSGWVDALESPFGACSGPRVRGLQWGQLQLLFGDQTSVSSVPEHFFYFSYGAFTGQPVTPAGLHTEAGIALGSNLAQLRAAYPELTVFEDPIFGAGFVVTQGGLSGSLTDTTDAGAVLVLYGGIGCGE